MSGCYTESDLRSMPKDISEKDLAIWERLAKAHETYSSALQDFFTDGIDRVALIRKGLHDFDRHLVISVAKYLREAAHKQLFDDWITMVSWAHGSIQSFRDFILALPRDWVLERIEEAVESHLNEGTMDEYRRFLELYADLDTDLALRLAHREAGHGDPEIREAGEDFLEWLA